MKKTFRLFISSTFNDFRREREVLQTKVFPHAKEYASSQGYTFQPIDLRWGVSNEAQLDQKTLELCLSEVRACKSHIHPNFLIMIGDRYGWIPLPYAIQTDEFKILIALMAQNDKEAVLAWYKKDLNQLPASYILKERSGEYVEFERWSAVETNIRTILQSTVNSSNLTEEQKSKYFLSATEAEVEEGIIPYIQPTKYQKDELLSKDSSLQTVDSEHIFGFFRDINKSTQIEDKFIQNDYNEAQDFKERVKAELLENNILHVKTIQTDKERVEETYLAEFEAKTLKFLKSQIDAQKAKETNEQFTPLQIELQAQSYFAQIKRKNFFAQESLRETIAEYISDDNQQPCIIYGASGRGKSSLMAKAIQEVEALHKRVIYRFVGATPYSSSSKELLTSIFDELGVDVRSEQEKIQTQEDKLALNANEKQESFEDFSYRIYSEINNIKENIVIFIDAVDQLGNDDAFLWLPTTLPKNVKIVISALNDASYKDDSRYFTTLKTKTQTIHEIPEFSEPKLLLAALLKKEDRTLQKEQETYFLEQFKSSPSPLYVSVAAQELKNWKSYDNNQELESTQQGIIKEFVENLHNVHHHDKEFVHKVLGYLYASRDGLSESELLQLISTDKEFILRMAPEIFHKNETNELPLVHWSRLQTQLKPFLSSKNQDNEELMYFFHREFEDVIAKLPNQREEHEAIIKDTQKLIVHHKDKPFEENRWGKLYIILITEYELIYKDKIREKEFVKFISMLDNKGWIECLLDYLLFISDSYQVNNNINTALIYRDILVLACELLYSQDKDLWVDKYITARLRLSLSYGFINKIYESFQLDKQSLKIIESYLRKNHNLWIKKYIECSISISASYYAFKEFTKSKDILYECLNIVEKEYEVFPEQWAETYMTVIGNLAITLTELQIPQKDIIELEKQNYDIAMKHYNKEPAKYELDYVIAVGNLAISYSKIDRFLPNALDLANEKYTLSKKLFEKQPQIHIDTFSSSLNTLADVYKKTGNLKKAILLQEQCLEIRQELYLKNSNQWLNLYFNILINLSTSYIENKQNTKVILLCEIFKNKFEQTKDYEVIEIWNEDYTHVLEILLQYNKKYNISEKKDILEKLYILYLNIYGFKSEKLQLTMDRLSQLSDKLEKVGRNNLCTCGSGKKYKKCCGEK
jgi:hypothetical protein